MKIGIVGGGASGMVAAITAASLGAEVVILEKNDRVGNKILATGNGKCNLSNLRIAPDCYRSEDPQRIGPILKGFTMEETLDFFHGLGLMTRERAGLVYPGCEQSSAVLDVLRFALAAHGVRVETACRVVGVSYTGGRFLVHSGGESPRSFSFDRLILACGSPAGLRKGETANGTELADGFALRRIPFYPALVQLRCGETFFRALAGVRCQASVALSVDGETCEENGELQLTDYGISGIPVFQLSRYAAKALAHGGVCPAVLDFLPDMEDGEWEALLETRRESLRVQSAEQFFTGTVHKKIIAVVLKQSGISPADPPQRIPERKLRRAWNMLKHFPITVTGTNPFANAQVCAGGVRLTEVTDDLEAKRQKGLYVTGELLDADGRCGGYNLQWAWTTGVTAGRAAAYGARDKKRKERERG